MLQEIYVERFVYSERRMDEERNRSRLVQIRVGVSWRRGVVVVVMVDEEAERRLGDGGRNCFESERLAGDFVLPPNNNATPKNT
jgi:hypothetical protein